MKEMFRPNERVEVADLPI